MFLLRLIYCYQNFNVLNAFVDVDIHTSIANHRGTGYVCARYISHIFNVRYKRYSIDESNTTSQTIS